MHNAKCLTFILNLSSTSFVLYSSTEIVDIFIRIRAFSDNLSPFYFAHSEVLFLEYGESAALVLSDSETKISNSYI